LSQTATPARRSMIRSSMIFSGLTLVSRFMGAARDLVISAKLGASLTPAADAYATALAFPNLFRRIFAEGAFSSAFLPSYARAMAKNGEADADRMASDALATIAAATIVVTIACQLAMPWLMYAINPGYVHDPVKFKLAVVLTQISMPYLPGMAITALLSGVLNARDRFMLSAAAPTAWNLAMLLAVLPQHTPVQAAYAASWATCIAGLLQACWLWWGARHTGANITLRLPRLTPEIKQIIGLAIPGTIAASATQLNVFVSGILASHTPGARMWLTVADRLYQLPLGLVGVAVGVALLPRLSAAVSTDNHDDAQAATDQAIVFAMALTLPAAAALTAMPFYLIDGLWQRGLFTHADALHASQALFHYGWGVPAFVLIRVLQPAFFARQDTRSPMRFGLISVAMNIALGIGLYQIIGVPGIAAATAVASWLTVAQLFAGLWRKGHYRPSARAWSKLIRVLAASVAMGVFLALASHFRSDIEAPFGHFRLAGVGAKEITVVGVCLLGAALYIVFLFAFRGLTPTEVRTALRRGRA
jgi:putative peptidoglycan lipid II flippase